MCICGVFVLCPVCLCITVLWHADLVCVVSVTGPCCDGSECLTRGLQQWMMGQGQSLNLAMHTFIVGRWLPSGSVISLGLIHKPEKGKKGYYDVWPVHSKC